MLLRRALAVGVVGGRASVATCGRHVRCVSSVGLGGNVIGRKRSSETAAGATGMVGAAGDDRSRSQHESVGAGTGSDGWMAADDTRNPFAIEVLDLREQAAGTRSVVSKDAFMTHSQATGEVTDAEMLDVHNEELYPILLNESTLPGVTWPRVYRQLHIPGANDGFLEAFADSLVHEPEPTGNSRFHGRSEQLSALPPLGERGGFAVPTEALPFIQDGTPTGSLGPALEHLFSVPASSFEEKFNVGVYNYHWGAAGEMLRATSGFSPPIGMVFASRSCTDQVIFGVELASAKVVEVPAEVLPFAPSAEAMLEVSVSNVYGSKHLIDSVELDYTPWNDRYRLQLADWIVKRIVFSDVVPVPLPTGSLDPQTRGDIESAGLELEQVASWVFALAGSQGQFATWEDTLGEKPLYKDFAGRSASNVEMAWPVWAYIEEQPHT